ncbi:MAG TPA: malto-oligosyltrehalose synthase [Tepidisphaeraceae bacterium]|jgi:(1->4)-alpha-D-glucan 1-alpha-D-glucosylmutase
MPATDAIDRLLEQAVDRAKRLRRLPVSTYRLQFHSGFTFKQATAILPYLARLGITHVYASPYLAAAKGSTHGYDVIDHNRLNPEVGTPEDYQAFLDGLKANGLTHILDTVPNHVGVATNDNSWWNDVLEHGRASRYADYFDITWQSNARPQLLNKVLIPTLGKPYGEALEAGELKLVFDAETGRFTVDYYAQRFPISPSTYGTILAEAGDVADLQAVARDAAALPAMPAERADATATLKKRLADLAKPGETKAALEKAVASFNAQPGNARGFDKLDRLLSAQNFRLADWHVAYDEINYRRFFDVNDLAALRMELPEVFEAAHAFILPKLAAGDISGLRIDHPDGLFDPAGYLLQLQRHYLLAVAKSLYTGGDWPTVRNGLLERLQTFDGVGEGADRWPLFVSVEKILAMHEPLIADWATHGTSGYDYLVMLNSLFVDPAAEPAIDALWQNVTHDPTPFDELIYRNKRMMLETSLASELHTLTHRLDCLAQKNRRASDFTFRTLQSALRETIACFGVYRTYVQGTTVTDVDRAHIEKAIAKAKSRNPRVVPAVFDYLRDTLLQRYPDTFDNAARLEQQEFTGKFQQLTSPVTAKGIEDTTFYQYNRFLSLNEVGGEPATFGIPPEQFHAFLTDRQRHWPFALSGSSTHDTKRSEDVRARLNVLSDLPEEWANCVNEWIGTNAPLRKTNDGHPSPAPDEEMLIYQTLLGAWPLGDAGDADFADRVQAYLLKAMREAKRYTRWGEPDEAHEAAVRAFAAALLDPKQSPAFHKTFDPLRRKVSHFGLLNSVSQTLVKLASPGVPDVYQGTELWDFSLVDPDNRRPVDYAKREALLAGIDAATPGELLKDMADGRIKLKVATAGLRLRRAQPDLFAYGDYSPLKAAGRHAGHVFGFVRSLGDRRVAVVTPLRTAKLVKAADGVPMGDIWGDTTVVLPSARWHDALTGGPIGSTKVSDLLHQFPVALLVADA